MNSSSILYVIAIPIGNPRDITYRAVETLENITALICEEYKSGAKLLSEFKLKKPLYVLNEHSESADINALFKELFIDNCGSYGLITDAGTPCFADPGAELVQLCYQYSIPVKSIPGVSSLTTALMIAGKRLDRFLYYGFLSANKDKRRQELIKIKNSQTCDYFFLDAPYRLKALVHDMADVLGENRKVRLMYRLTYPEEQVFVCNLGELKSLSQSLPKGEFVLLLEK